MMIVKRFHFICKRETSFPSRSILSSFLQEIHRIIDAHQLIDRLIDSAVKTFYYGAVESRPQLVCLIINRGRRSGHLHGRQANVPMTNACPSDEHQIAPQNLYESRRYCSCYSEASRLNVQQERDTIALKQTQL